MDHDLAHHRAAEKFEVFGEHSRRQRGIASWRGSRVVRLWTSSC
ncbi:MAG: hypothetical protein AAGB18_08250 [Pseudomonadota bacterium]